MKKIIVLSLALILSLNTLCFADVNNDEYKQLKNYIGYQWKELNDTQLDKLNGILNEIRELNRHSSNFDYEYDQRINQMDRLLDQYGVEMYIKTAEELIDLYPDTFTEEEQTYLIKYVKMLDDRESVKSFYEAYEGLYEIFTRHFGESAYKCLFMFLNDSMLIDEYSYSDSIIKRNYGFNMVIKKNDVKLNDLVVGNSMSLIPEDYRHYVSIIQLGTDGRYNNLAYVKPYGSDNLEWILYLDPRDALTPDGEYDDALHETIVHEFAHILSLNGSQLDNLETETYETSYGFAAKDSYINRFYQKFWLKIIDAHQSMDHETFARKHSSQFVTDYASTDPSEDFAETFASFVLNDKPKTFQVKDDKILWMYEQEELVKLRDEMRTNLDKLIVEVDDESDEAAQ